MWKLENYKGMARIGAFRKDPGGERMKTERHVQEFCPLNFK